jgi:hypothetical protein
LNNNNCLVFLGFFCHLLVGCGGGSGGEGGDTDLPMANQPPTLSVNDELNVKENSRFVSQITISDPDSSNLSLSLRGTDASKFEISAENRLAFVQSVDFEDPLDEDVDNIYEIVVVVSDGQNQVDKSVRVKVEDLVEEKWDQRNLDENVFE